MKKLLVLLLTVFALTSCEQDSEIIGIDAEKKLPKVDVCHYDADTDTWKTISINGNALKAHLEHGDFEGACSDRPGYTYVPDTYFEQWMIWEGYDDVLDNYVLTANINTVKRVSLPVDDPSAYISDLTGLQDFKALETLSFGDYKEVLIDFSELKELKHLRVTMLFGRTTIDLTKNEKLTSLYLREWNDLQSIDLSKNKNLNFLSIVETVSNMVELDLSHNKALTKIYFEQFYGPTSIDLSKNKNLQEVYFDCNFTTLDLSNNHVLSDVLIASNDYLTSLNLQNGNNLNFDRFIVSTNNPSLVECFQVDDAEWSTANWSTDYTYSEDCY